MGKKNYMLTCPKFLLLTLLLITYNNFQHHNVTIIIVAYLQPNRYYLIYPYIYKEKPDLKTVF